MRADSQRTSHRNPCFGPLPGLLNFYIELYIGSIVEAEIRN